MTRMLVVSVLFSILYLGCIVAFHKGAKPLKETIDLLRDLLPRQGDNGQSKMSDAQVSIDASDKTETAMV